MEQNKTAKENKSTKEISRIEEVKSAILNAEEEIEYLTEEVGNLKLLLSRIDPEY